MYVLHAHGHADAAILLGLIAFYFGGMVGGPLGHSKIFSYAFVKMAELIDRIDGLPGGMCLL